MNRWWRRWHYVAAFLSAGAGVLCGWAAIHPGGSPWFLLAGFAALNILLADWNWRQARS